MKDIGRTIRVAWAVASFFVVQSVVFGMAVLPGALFWQWHLQWRLPFLWMRIVVLAMAVVPAYLMFALTLMALSAWSMRLFGWRTPLDAEMRIAVIDWALLDWARYMVATQIVRVLVGSSFRASPLWTLYLRLNGARIGRGVYVNTVSIADHNLIEIGDHTVVGAGVHMSGHTVEGGMVKTARLTIGRDVTLGVDAVVGLGVEIGDRCQVGALTFIPKYARLRAGQTYVGIPAHPLETSDHEPGALQSDGHGSGPRSGDRSGVA
jgi:acetyltransferase-like isoleucine patch superfamily enzyme